MANGHIRRDGWEFWALVALSIGGVVQILGLPLIVGALEDHWGYTAAYSGYITSVDLAGLFVGSATTSMWASRINWKRYIAGAILLCIVLNVLCVWFHTLGILMVLRFGAGLASGVAYASSLTLMSRVQDTARGFSIVIFAQVLANAAVLAVFPVIDATWGPGGLFVTIAAVMAATAVIVPRLPGRDPVAESDIVVADRRAGHDPPLPGQEGAAAKPGIVVADSGAGHGPPLPGRESAAPREEAGAAVAPPVMRVAMAALCLGAVALVYVAIGSYWAYAERMGIAFDISAGVVHQLLTASVLLSTIGCLVAFRLSRSVGQSRPLLGALALLSAVLLIHSRLPQPVMYVVTLVVMQMCWNLIDIFQLGTLSIVDPSGSAAALVPAAQGIALAAGPAAGAVALTAGGGYWAVLSLAGGAAALALLCYSIVYGRYLRVAEPLGSHHQPAIP
jgi:MFS transporter, DHA1 family, inner membrane transport protein